MKRFLFDAALIAMIIIIGSSLKEVSVQDMNDKIEDFELQQQAGLPWKSQEDEDSFYTIDENKASSFALFMSNMIVDSVRIGTLAVTDFFTALLV